MLAIACLLASLLLGVLVGPTNLNPFRVLTEIIDWVLPFSIDSGLSNIESSIVIDIRLPRVIMALLVGAMLALSGSAYQGVFRNPLAEPYLLGVAAGAGLGATIAIITNLGESKWSLPIFAFVGGFVASAISYFVGSAGKTNGRLDNTVSLILAGVSISSFFTAIQVYLQQAHVDTLREVYSWVLGRFSVQGFEEILIVLPYFFVTSFVILLYRRVLSAFEVGEEEAYSLGVDVRTSRLIVLLAASISASVAVAFTGLIGFVGIIIPHLVRLLFSNSYRVILPLSMILGASFLVLADLLARTAVSPGELPIGVVTAFVGAPFFVFVLYRARTA